MAVITPTTDVYLLKVPLEINDLNQLTFNNATAQYNYFNSLPKLEVHDFTYQRKDGVIRYGASFDSLISYNYVMYRNDEFSNKWFYAFITGLEWKSPNSTDISIKTDVWQTWQFDLTFKPVLIDREHTNNDTIGANTLPEGLELGEFITNGVSNFFTATSYCVIAEVSQVQNYGDGQSMSYTIESTYTPDLTPKLNDMPRGTIPLILEYGESGAPKFDKLKQIYDKAGLSDSIINVYVLPNNYIAIGSSLNIAKLTINALNPSNGTVIDSVEHVGLPLPTGGTYLLNETTFTKPSTLAGYTPKNNKLFTYPYFYFNISNNSGTSLPYHYEDFSGTIKFSVEGTFGLSGNIKAIPNNYKNLGTGNAIDYSITGGKYPVASWTSDSYTNWLTQNAVNMQTQWNSTLISAGVDVFGGGATGGAGGAVVGTIAGAKEIITTAREQHLAKTRANFIPDQVKGNVNAGDLVWAKYRTPFTYMPMCIKPEYARCIDEFFSQYGYKCNRVKTPNITGRRNWNYVKTVGCYIEGNIPQDDITEIKNMFDRGITLWHNPATFADYSQNNDII